MSTDTDRIYAEVFEQVKHELDVALKKHPHTHPSVEHSFAVLSEEYYELMKEVHKSDKWREVEDMCEEACQLAACAVRLIADMRVRKAEGYEYWGQYVHKD